MAVLSGGGRGLRLPLVLTDDEEIDVLCVLVHAGQAIAVMQLVADPLGGTPRPGLVVTEITPAGWSALEVLMRQREA